MIEAFFTLYTRRSETGLTVETVIAKTKELERGVEEKQRSVYVVSGGIAASFVNYLPV